MATQLSNNGINAMLQQQGFLLQQMMEEMKDMRKEPGQRKANQMMEVVRSLEGRLDQAKWPSRIDNKLEDIDDLLEYMKPGLDEKKPQAGRKGIGQTYHQNLGKLG